jgi:transcriptional regulator with XRE-family HTH domain
MPRPNRPSGYSGLQLRLMRTARGVTVTELAEVMGKSRPTVSNIERTGSVTLPVATAYRTALESFPKPADHDANLRGLAENVA